MRIYLNEFVKITDFVHEATKFCEQIDVLSGNYVVNAKSLLGVMSLNLSEPVEAVIHSDDQDVLSRFEDVCSKYSV